MYKIYIGEVPLLLVSKEESNQYKTGSLRDLMVEYIPKKPKNLFQCIDNLEKGSKSFDSIIVVAEDLEELREEFFGIYKIYKAGGGLVFNEKQEVLAIFRSGFWDLPKGKQEKGETIDQTAIREVQEETGLVNIELKEFICDTFHTYTDRDGKRVLKWATWYKMASTDKELTPQAEEDIDLAVWLPVQTLKEKTPIYKNILEVLQQL